MRSIRGRSEEESMNLYIARDNCASTDYWWFTSKPVAHNANCEDCPDRTDACAEYDVADPDGFMEKLLPEALEGSGFHLEPGQMVVAEFRLVAP
jgi:hypothetical protein